MENATIKGFLPEGVETIEIPVTFRDYNTEIPACRVKSEDGQYYRILHKSLEIMFREICEMYPEIRIRKNVITAQATYAAAGIQLYEKDVPITAVHYGETKVLIESTSAEKAAPLTNALNRAFDKALMELLKMDSRIFDENGIQINTSGDIERLVIHKKKAEPVSYLNEQEQAELNNLAAQVLSFQKGDNSTVTFTMENLPPAYIKFICEMKDPGKYAAMQNTVKRYLELKTKAAGPAA
ncbi:MAG: hypothetical protein J5949_08585 [Oscillospiraceae bacterium]|nr:hypothetical protein [Oscillospiraceae bacterium]